MPTITDLTYSAKTGSKRDQSKEAMKKRIDYIMGKASQIGSLGVNADSPKQVYDEFMKLKEMFGKTTGNNFMHYAISFSQEDKITKDEVASIVDEFLSDKRFYGYQIMYGIHDDTDNMHAHVLINTVNMINGKKWHFDNPKRDMLDMQIKLNIIAQKYDCKIPEKIKAYIDDIQVKTANQKRPKQEKSVYEQEMQSKGKSWKNLAKDMVEYIAKNSLDIDDFIINSKKCGYDIYKNKDDEYIITIKKINKKISLTKLSLSIDELQKRFEYNMVSGDKELMKENIQRLSKKTSLNKKLDDINQKAKSYEKAYKSQDKNRQLYYKDLANDLKKYIREHSHLKEKEEIALLSLIKYSLNSHKTLGEALGYLDGLGIKTEINTNQDINNIIFDIDGYKISTSYLKIDIENELNKSVSWKYEMYQDIKQSLYKATNKEEFEDELKKFGIKMTWTQERAYITFEDKYGNRRRNNKFYPPEKFSKQAFEESFKKNKENQIKKTQKKEEYEQKRLEYEKNKKYYKALDDLYIISAIFKIVNFLAPKHQIGGDTPIIAKMISSLADEKARRKEMKKGTSLNERSR